MGKADAGMFFGGILDPGLGLDIIGKAVKLHGDMDLVRILR